jgi:hypothetical protein
MLKKYIDLVRFQASRLSGCYFDADILDFHSSRENDYFLKCIRGCKQYLEFGAGASTLVAASEGVNTVTIESDAMFMAAVVNSLCNKKIDQYVTPITRQIGLLGPWGSPFISIFSPVTRNRARSFREYSAPPQPPVDSFRSKHQYNMTEGNVYLPDLILIDGKFRVACALKLLEYFRHYGHTDYEIIVDDYVGREQYHIIEKFFEVEKKMDEFAIFHHKSNIDHAKLLQTIMQFELIHD